MPTLAETLAYLGIDDAGDEMILLNVSRCLRTARKLLHGGVGEEVEEYLPQDPRITELILLYTEDLYSNQGLSAKTAGAMRRKVLDLELQLRVELARAKEAL